MQEFVPLDFSIPQSYSSAFFRLSPLTVQLAERDYSAILCSNEHIRYVFGPDNSWPAPTLSFSENVADIMRHESQFADRSGFTFAILGARTDAYYGCLYIKRIKSRLDVDLRKKRFGAQVFFWLDVRYSTPELEKALLDEIAQWLDLCWCFGEVAFPGRTIDWDSWAIMAGSRGC